MDSALGRLGARIRGVPAPSWAALGVSLALHLVFGFGFRVHQPLPVAGPYVPPGITYQPPLADLAPSAAFRFEAQMILQDPTLLSLPHRRGFSRDAIDRWVHTAYRRPVWGWRDAALPAPRAEAIQRPILPEMSPSSLVTQRVRVSNAAPGSGEQESTAVSWPDEPVWRLVGGLGDMEVVTPPEFRRVPAAAPERPARVRIGVGPRGRVQHAVLLVRTGDPRTDQAVVDGLLALRLLRPEAGDASPGILWVEAEVLWPPPEPVFPLEDGGSETDRMQPSVAGRAVPAGEETVP